MAGLRAGNRSNWRHHVALEPGFTAHTDYPVWRTGLCPVAGCVNSVAPAPLKSSAGTAQSGVATWIGATAQQAAAGGRTGTGVCADYFCHGANSAVALRAAGQLATATTRAC